MFFFLIFEANECVPEYVKEIVLVGVGNCGFALAAALFQKDKILHVITKSKEVTIFFIQYMIFVLIGISYILFKRIFSARSFLYLALLILQFLFVNLTRIFIKVKMMVVLCLLGVFQHENISVRSVFKYFYITIYSLHKDLAVMDQSFFFFFFKKKNIFFVFFFFYINRKDV